MAQPKFTKKRIIEGWRFDTVAQLAYGDPEKVVDLILDNRHLAATQPLPAGEIIYVRIPEELLTNDVVPPWFTDEEVQTPPVENTGSVGIGVIDGPIVPLGFSQGYPRVVNNKIEFAINKTDRFTYKVFRKDSGAVISESTGYDFTAGFPVVTSTITDGSIYRVKVGSLESEDITVVGIGTPLAFAVAPYYQKLVAQSQIRWTINKTGDYLTKLTRKSDNVVVFNAIQSYLEGVEFALNIEATADYRVDVGTITADVDTVEIESTVQPIDIVLAGYSYDYQSLALSFYLQSTADYEMSVTRVDGIVTNGLTFPGNPTDTWTVGQYIPGTTAYLPFIPPFTDAFPFNPLTPGAGGIANLTEIVVRVRKVSDRTKVFKFNFTTPGVNKPFYTPIELTPEEEPPTTCERAPTFAGPVTYVIVSGVYILQFKLDASKVYAFEYRMKKAGVVEFSGVVDMVDGSLHPIFSPANVPKISLSGTPDPGAYTLELRGKSCSSGWSSPASFTILDESEEPEPPVVTGPITPKIASFGLAEHFNAQIAGSSEDWTISDTSTELPGSGYEHLYDIGGARVRGAQLRNYKYESNRTLSIIHYRIKIGEPDLSQVGVGSTDKIQTFSQNTSAGYCIIEFNEHA